MNYIQNTCPKSLPGPGLELLLRVAVVSIHNSGPKGGDLIEGVLEHRDCHLVILAQSFGKI